MMRCFLVFFLGWLVSFYAWADEQSTARYFEKIKQDPHALYRFLKNMPKGGELHYHFSGGVDPEVMLNLAQKQPFCLDTQTFTLTSFKSVCLGVPSSLLIKPSPWHRKILQAWSFMAFDGSKASAHDHFFSTFGKFQAVYSANRADLLASILQRAAQQHERYMELLILPEHTPPPSVYPRPFIMQRLAQYHRQVLANRVFQDSVMQSREELKDIKQQARQQLHCDVAPNRPACQIVVVFQYYALREQPLEKVFVQLLQGFVLAQHSDEVVGVNLVQAEDGPISSRDYHQHMRLLDYLHHAYPQVHITLHAGELSPRTSPLKDRQYHIREAIQLGHAERIGHGVDILTEENHHALLKQMASTPIPVEVNLTSNRTILQVTGQAHPLHDYLKHQVPVVLSTDDEGILRTSLTKEYVLAAREYHLNYKTLKQISRNALTYGFIPGKSLWAMSACRRLTDSRCLQWVAHSKKAKLQWLLEQDFLAFER